MKYYVRQILYIRGLEFDFPLLHSNIPLESQFLYYSHISILITHIQTLITLNGGLLNLFVLRPRAF
jgi:hypothetical protein